METRFEKSRLPSKCFRSARHALFCALVFGAVGCASKKAATPSELYSNVGPGRVGGPMRLAANHSTPRNPPRLPVIVDKRDPALAWTKGMQPPMPPAPHEKTSANPTVVSSPVPNEADGYFGGAPAGMPALGGLFDSIFVPPTPPTPTAISSATYQVVK